MIILRVAFTLIVTGIAVICGILIWDMYEETPWAREGRVRVKLVNIAPEVSGNVIEVLVKDNQFVRAGDVVFRIDPASYEIALRDAEAKLEGLKSSAYEAQLEYERRTAQSQDSISREDLQQHETRMLTAQASVRQAKANVDNAKLNLERTNVKSLVDGYISNLNLHTASYAKEGSKMLAVAASDSFYVYGYLQETKVKSVRPGNRAQIRLMAYDAPVSGYVAGIAQAIAETRNATSSSDLLQSVNPVFTWIRLPQRIPVHVRIDDIPPGVMLSGGMIATVAIDPTSQSGMPTAPQETGGAPPYNHLPLKMLPEARATPPQMTRTQ